MGSSDLDQLEKIFVLCGTPTESDWPGFSGYPTFSSTVEVIKKKYTRSITERFSVYALYLNLGATNMNWTF